LDKNLCIMSPFFNLLKAKDLNSRLKYKAKNKFPLELVEIDFKVQRNRAITGTTSSLVSFYQYILNVYINFKICFLHVLLFFEMTSFHKILKQSNKSSACNT